MKKIVIFAGTTEGRRLSEILADAGIAHTVCVATEYGEIVMREQTDAEAAGTKGQPLVSLHRGRMDRQQMEEFLRSEGYEIVVDATHPYARVVTENIRDAVKTQSSIYLRLEREISEIPEAMDGDKVTLLGMDGTERITAEELGELSGRFNYEFVCDLGKRIPRVYLQHGEITEVRDYFENF